MTLMVEFLEKNKASMNPKVKEFALSLLPAEQQQIVDAYQNGCIDFINEKHLSAYDYFDNTFK